MSQLTDQIHQLETQLGSVATAHSVAALADPAARFVAERVLSGTPVPQNASTYKALQNALTALA